MAKTKKVKKAKKRVKAVKERKVVTKPQAAPVAEKADFSCIKTYTTIIRCSNCGNKEKVRQEVGKPILKGLCTVHKCSSCGCAGHMVNVGG